MADPTSGSFVAEVSPFPVRVQRGQEWIDVDTSLERGPDDSIRSVATEVGIEVGQGNGTFVSVESEGHSLGFRWPNPLPAPSLFGDLAIWPNVAPGIDLAVRSDVLGIRQFVVVRTPEAAADPLLENLRLGYEAPGLEVRESNGGFVASSAADGTPIFAGPQLRMWESPVDVSGTAAEVSAAAIAAPEADDARSAVVGLRVTDSAFVLTPDRDLLTDPGTRFPVIIDPAVSLERVVWGMVWSDGQEFWNDSSEHARVGYDGWSGFKKSRVFYRFSTSTFAGATINSATFAHKQIHSTRGCEVNDGVPGVELWYTGGISDSLSWSNQPEWREKLATASIAHGNSDQCPGFTRTEWNATAGARIVVDEGFNTFAVGLRSVDESEKLGWRIFDNDGTYPVLVVNYNHKPDVPGAVTSPDLIDYNGVKFVAKTTPRLSVKVSDPNGGQVRGVFILNPYDADGSFDDRVFLTSQYVSSGGTASVVVPSGMMVNGSKYSIYARADDGQLESSSGPGTWVTVDTSAPAAPAIIGPTANPAVGQTARFTIDSSSADAARYVWGINTDTPSTSVTPSSLGGAASADVVIPQFGPSFFTAYAIDRAGNRSATKRYEFKVDGTLPSHRYRLDGNGVDLRAETSPGSSGTNLTVGSGTAWSEGRDYRDVNGIRDCTDEGLSVSSTSSVTDLVSSGDPGDTSRQFSIAAWVRPSSIKTFPTWSAREAAAVSMFTGDTSAMMMGYRKATDTSTPLWIAMVDTDGSPGGRGYLSTDIEVNTATWTHLAMVWSPESKTASFYIDGVLAAELVIEKTVFNASRLQVGGAPTGPYYVGWNGVVDEVLLFPGVLDAGQALKWATDKRLPVAC